MFTTRVLFGGTIVISGKITATCAISYPQESAVGERRVYTTRDAGVGRISADASQRTEDQ